MKTYIYIDNFRGFSDALIPITEVNFLVGENSTGKTSFLELIEMFSNVPYWLFDPRYGAPDAPQRHFFDLVSASSPSKRSFTVGAVEVSDDPESPHCGMLVTYRNFDGRAVPERVSIVDGVNIRTVHGELWRSGKEEKYKARHRVCIGNAEDAIVRCFVKAHKSSSAFKEKTLPEELQGQPMFMRFADFFFDGKGIGERGLRVPEPFPSTLVELAPIRTRPRRTYDAPQTSFSPEGEHTPYVVKKRLASKSQAEKFKQYLETAGSSSGLFKSISIRSYGAGTQAPFEMKIELGKASLDLQNVGYGVSQALPVIVEMFVRPKNTAFAIQQPEVHLHPKAQATIGDLMAELARSENKKFFVETHSDFTIDRFRLNIRKNGEIASQLLFFERTENGNAVTTIPIQSDGSLPAEQPNSYREFFFNESLSVLS